MFESLSILRQTNICVSKPSKILNGETYGCRIWRGRCGSGKEIQFCLHGAVATRSPRAGLNGRASGSKAAPKAVKTNCRFIAQTNQ